MARYKLMNVQIKKVGLKADGTIDSTINPDGKRRFMTASLIPTGGVWAAAAGSLPPIFDEEIIRLYEPLLSTQNGGTAQADQPLPDELAFLNGAWAEWIAPAPFYKKYLVGVQARKPTPLVPQGRPAYPAGHKVMNADGSAPVIYTSLRVFTIFYRDEDLNNEIRYRPGFSVNELGTAQFANYCEYVQPQAAPIPQDDAMGDTVNTASIQQPAFTQQPQFVQQPQGTTF